MTLATIGLVYPEARVKFKNIDFWTEANFASYCTEPESASRIGVVIRQEFIFIQSATYLPTSANPQAEVFNSHATLQS